MTVANPPSLGHLTGWLSRHDPHAALHLSLVQQADRALSDPSTGPSERSRLADRLERWRYQHLRERDGNSTEEDWRFVETLDLAANVLWGQPARPARTTGLAVSDRSARFPGIEAAFDPCVDSAELCRQAQRLTEQHCRVRFAEGVDSGRRAMTLYAPLYLSSHCINHCVYCGFRYPHAIHRKHLTLEEAILEAAVLESRGFRHILLVGGDFPRLTTVDYFRGVLEALVERGDEPGLEIAPQTRAGYAALRAAGACGVTLYQETYDRRLYAGYHPRGTKAAYDWRLEGLDRAAEAGLERVGLGVLLGLADPREDMLAMARHARYLQSRFPALRLAFSLPRIREAPDAFHEPYQVDDERFVRLYCALRIDFPAASLVLSTRESPALRNRLARLCITQISAGSSTTPGGYQDSVAAADLGVQFPTSDRRTAAEMAQWLGEQGFEVLWQLPKD